MAASVALVLGLSACAPPDGGGAGVEEESPAPGTILGLGGDLRLAQAFHYEDGGSLRFDLSDATDTTLRFCVSFCMDGESRGLLFAGDYIDGREMPRGGPEEAALLAVLRQYATANPDQETDPCNYTPRYVLEWVEWSARGNPSEFPPSPGATIWK